MDKIHANKDFEVTKLWHELTDFEKECMVVSHADNFRRGGAWVSNERMGRILELGTPKCVFAYKDGKIQYFRVHKDSIDVMKVLCNNYLDESILETDGDIVREMLDDANEEL